MITLINARGCFLVLTKRLHRLGVLLQVTTGGSENVCLQRAEECRMFKFLRTAAEALGRAGLKLMTNGVRTDWLFCGRGFKAPWREMFTSLFR